MFQKIKKVVDGTNLTFNIVSDKESGMSILTEIKTKTVICIQNSSDGGLGMVLEEFKQRGVRHIESWT